MNPMFQAWYNSGKIVEALSGKGDYFVADHTYRSEHNQLLAIHELVFWAAQGHTKQAADGFEIAIEKLLEENDIRTAFHLFLGYGIIKENPGETLSINENRIETLIADKVQKQGERFVKSEELRNLLLQVIKYFPKLGHKLEIN